MVRKPDLKILFVVGLMMTILLVTTQVAMSAPVSANEETNHHKTTTPDPACTATPVTPTANCTCATATSTGSVTSTATGTVLPPGTVATSTPSAPTATGTLTNTETPGAPTATGTLTNTETPGAPTATGTSTVTETPGAPTATGTLTNTETPGAPTATGTQTPEPTGTATGTVLPPSTVATATPTPKTTGEPPTPTPTPKTTDEPPTPTGTTTVEPPTALTLASFVASPQANGVSLSWTTGTELNAVGFRIWRSADGQRANAVQISDLIARQGTSTNGATYRYVDSTAVTGTQYTYWLQEVHADQTTEDLGFATLQVTGTLYLPMVNR